MNTPSKEQIAEWKTKYGQVFLLEAEDGKVAYIHDPLLDFAVTKLIFTALGKSAMDFASSVLANCWLAGDEEIRLEERYANDLASKIDDIILLPDFLVDREADAPVYTIKVEGEELRVRQAKREDIMDAERRNARNEHFQTAAYLLERICVDLDSLGIVKKNNRIYIGFLRATNAVKDKTYVSVKKL